MNRAGVEEVVPARLLGNAVGRLRVLGVGLGGRNLLRRAVDRPTRARKHHLLDLGRHRAPEHVERSDEVHLRIELRTGDRDAYSGLRGAGKQDVGVAEVEQVAGRRGAWAGLVNLEDRSWGVPGGAAVGKYEKGGEVEGMVVAIDVERERISLGIKQLEGDPFTNFVAGHDKGSLVDGVVKSIDPKGAVIQLEEDIEGYLRASEVSRDRVEDIRTHLKEGDKVNAMIINIDRKNRNINLSIKAKDAADETEEMQKHAADGA